jgi:hypothetical protein
LLAARYQWTWQASLLPSHARTPNSSHSAALTLLSLVSPLLSTGFCAVHRPHQNPEPHHPHSSLSLPCLIEVTVFSHRTHSTPGTHTFPPPRYSFLALFTHSLPAFLVTSLALIRWLSFASIVTVRIATSFCVDFQHSVHLSPRGFEKALRTPCAGPTNLQSIHLVGLDSQYSTTDRRRLAIRTTAQLSTPSRPHHTVLSLCQRRQAS